MPALRAIPADHTFYGGCNMPFKPGAFNLLFLLSLDDKTVNLRSAACNISDTLNLDFADLMLEQVRQAMFLAAVDRAASWWVSDGGPTSPDLDYMQRVTAERVRSITTYVVRYYLWDASVAGTYLIILFVLPMYWGVLDAGQEADDGPVYLARAFGAPTLRKYVGEVKLLLAVVGHVRVRDARAFGEEGPLTKGLPFLILLIVPFSSGLEATPE